MARRKRGWLTPETLAGDEICRPLFIPANSEVLSIVGGALSELTKAYNYEQSGTVTPEETSEFMTAMLARWYEEQCGGEVDGVPTPFWDEASDVDDAEPEATQTWYGEVDDPEAPAGELTFTENALVWGFTGFLAFSGVPGAALLFHTIAPSFVLAMRGGDFGEVIRIIVDGEEAARVDTTGQAGEVIEIPIAGDSALSLHEIIMILVG